MKVLELTLFVKEDCLAINIQIKDEHIVLKRTVLRQIPSVYDPLGLYIPLTEQAKSSRRECRGSREYNTELLIC